MRIRVPVEQSQAADARGGHDSEKRDGRGLGECEAIPAQGDVTKENTREGGAQDVTKKRCGRDATHMLLMRQRAERRLVEAGSDSSASVAVVSAASARETSSAKAMSTSVLR